MDVRDRIAREIEPQAWAALGIRDTLAYKNRRTSSLRKADRIIASLAADSRQIIHRDENHGPTLERDGFAEPDVMAMSNGVISLHYEDLDAAQSAFEWLEARAMGEKK